MTIHPHADIRTPIAERIAGFYDDLAKVSAESGKLADAREYEQKARDLRSETVIDWEAA